jgi:Icc-related predicted phosphoesterase
MQTRLFYATDLHGSEQCFMKFINSAKFYNARVIVCGGDITGKMIVPLIETTKGTYEVEFMGKPLVVRGDEETTQLEKSIAQVGYYAFRTTKVEMERLNANRDQVDRLFSELMIQRVEKWMHIAEARLKESGIKCIMNAGNDDRIEIDQALGSSEYVIFPEGKVVDLDEKHEMISTGYTNITPWKCPRDIPEEELAKIIENMTSKVSKMENCIFSFHCPPFRSNIDDAPKLDNDLKPTVTPGGQMQMTPAGSTAVRAAIEKYQPLLGLHGHIHESRGSTKIGRTLCLNPGSEYAEGTLRGALVTLDDGKVKSYQLTSG